MVNKPIDILFAEEEESMDLHVRVRVRVIACSWYSCKQIVHVKDYDV